MNCFKLIRKGLKRGHVFYLDNGTPECQRRVIYSLKDCAYVDKKTVGEYRQDPAEEIIEKQYDEIKEIKRILKSGKKEKEEIEKYLKVIGINYDIVLDIDPYKVNTNPLVYEYVRKVYNLKEYRWYLVKSLYMKTRYSIINHINLFLSWILWPRISAYSSHKKVADYLRENPHKSYSSVDLTYKFFKYASQKTFEKNIEAMNLILRELTSSHVAISSQQGRYGYNPDGQLDFKERTTPSFSTIVALFALLFTLVYYFLYFLANKNQILLSLKNLGAGIWK